MDKKLVLAIALLANVNASANESTQQLEDLEKGKSVVILATNLEQRKLIKLYLDPAANFQMTENDRKIAEKIIKDVLEKISSGSHMATKGVLE